MNTKTYNGWKNWETWNVALWCDNEEPIYRERMRMKPRTAQDCEGFVRAFYPNGTPDMKGCDAYSTARNPIDWQEIADHWQDDYGEEGK